MCVRMRRYSFLFQLVLLILTLSDIIAYCTRVLAISFFFFIAVALTFLHTLVDRLNPIASSIDTDFNIAFMLAWLVTFACFSDFHFKQMWSSLKRKKPPKVLYIIIIHILSSIILITYSHISFYIYSMRLLRLDVLRLFH